MLKPSVEGFCVFVFVQFHFKLNFTPREGEAKEGRHQFYPFDDTKYLITGRMETQKNLTHCHDMEFAQ